MKGITWYSLMVCLVSLFALSAFGADDLILENQIVEGGQTTNLFAGKSITVGPDFIIQGGAVVSLRAGGHITLKPGFKAYSGSKVHMSAWGQDDVAPVIISAYPGNDRLVATQSGWLKILATYGDDRSGIYSVKLYDESDNDITGQARLTANTIELVLKEPEDGPYRYRLVLEDSAGNVTSNDLSFEVDTTVPITRSSIQGGNFENPVTVDLVCSETATIYYSTDGYPPFVGADNTISAPGPIMGIEINGTTKLQFFSIDTAGNVETVKKELYQFDEHPWTAGNLSAFYNGDVGGVELGWSPVVLPVEGYHIYRCHNALDLQALNESHLGRYPPPEQLRISPEIIQGSPYIDSEIISGVTYWYAVTVIDEEEVEGRTSVLVPVVVPSSSVPQDREDAVKRALVYLESEQSKEGYWGHGEGTRMLATSQALNAFRITQKDNAGIRKALFYLRGHHEVNNDFLARKIFTLCTYRQNTEEEVNRLISRAKIHNNVLYGWGLRQRFRYDAIDTALGTLALDCSTRGLDLYLAMRDAFRVSSDIKSEAGFYGWVPERDTSIYVSSFVYHLLKASGSQFQWIIDKQGLDGSFDNNLVDTAAVLLWLGNLHETVKDKAINYIISKQSLNGSWLDDHYMTALCLEALLNEVGK